MPPPATLRCAWAATHRRMDLAACRARIRGPHGELPADGEPAPLFRFDGRGYALELCLHASAVFPEDVFVLVWDCDPDGGEPFPDEDTVADAVARAA